MKPRVFSWSSYWQHQWQPASWPWHNEFQRVWRWAVCFMSTESKISRWATLFPLRSFSKTASWAKESSRRRPVGLLVGEVRFGFGWVGRLVGMLLCHRPCKLRRWFSPGGPRLGDGTSHFRGLERAIADAHRSGAESSSLFFRTKKGHQRKTKKLGFKKCRAYTDKLRQTHLES